MQLNVNIYEKLNIQASSEYLGEVLFNTIFEKKEDINCFHMKLVCEKAMPSSLYRYMCFSHRRLLVRYRMRMYFNKKKNGIYSC